MIDGRRRDLKVSAEVLAKAMGISRQSYYVALKSENGFNDRQILKACEVLECKVVFSFGEAVWAKPVKSNNVVITPAEKEARKGWRNNLK